MNIRAKSFLITAIVYLIALVVSVVGAYQLIGSHQWLLVLTGHLIATVVVFIASQIYKNSSLYDPFWSVAPIPIAIYVALWPESTEINIEKVLLILIPIMFWAFRLTVNWIRDWDGLGHEDFRYVNLKAKPFAVLIDLFGIHVYPTLQVNLSLFPIYFALSVSTNEVGVLLYLASIFTVLAVFLELVADEQMRTFRRDSANKGKTMTQGLWAYSRHPNYLGEILFWWGLYFMTVSIDSSYWYLFICPLVMNLMFSLITCQMMDNRSLERRPEYADYMKSTRQLILWKKS